MLHYILKRNHLGVTSPRVFVKVIRISDEELFFQTPIGRYNLSELYDAPVSFAAPTLFEAVYMCCFIRGRRMVTVPRHRMIVLFIKAIPRL